MEKLLPITPEQIRPTLHEGREDSPELGTAGMQGLLDAHAVLNTAAINDIVTKQNVNNTEQGAENTRLSQGISSAQSIASTAAETANAAAAAVAGAQKTAAEAITIAKGVDGKATAALQNSNEALSVAGGAMQTSKRASETAKTALDVASGIDEKATTAISTANSALAISVNNAAAVQDALYTAGQAYEVAASATKAQDPTTGIIDTVQNVLNNIFYSLMSPISAIEFDNLNLTAGEFDAKNFTTYEFDTRAKSILIGG